MHGLQKAERVLLLLGCATAVPAKLLLHHVKHTGKRLFHMCVCKCVYVSTYAHTDVFIAQAQHGPIYRVQIHNMNKYHKNINAQRHTYLLCRIAVKETKTARTNLPCIHAQHEQIAQKIKAQRHAYLLCSLAVKECKTCSSCKNIHRSACVLLPACKHNFCFQHRVFRVEPSVPECVVRVALRIIFTSLSLCMYACVPEFAVVHVGMQGWGVVCTLYLHVLAYCATCAIYGSHTQTCICLTCIKIQNTPLRCPLCLVYYDKSQSGSSAQFLEL